MKHEYHITAYGERDEKDIVASLEKIGLHDVFVEKLLDIEAFVLEMKDERDEGIPEKWDTVTAQSFFPKNGLGEMMKSSIAAMPHQSFRAVITELHRCCMERGMSELMTGLLLSQAADILVK